jgi:transcription antitermination factor NusG
MDEEYSRLAGGGKTMPWHIIRTKPNHELSAALLLQTRFDVYLPLYTAAHDRRRPLFPGYMFAMFEWEHHHVVLCTPGVLPGGQGILRMRNEDGALDPYVIAPEELERVRVLELAGAVPARQAFRPGEQVEVRVHHLRMYGRFERSEGTRAHVRIEILGREVSVIADLADVGKVA